MRLRHLFVASLLAAGCAPAVVPATAPAPLAVGMQAAPALDMGEGDATLELRIAEAPAARRLLAGIFNLGQVTEVRIKVARTGGNPDGRFAEPKTLTLAYPLTNGYPQVSGLAVGVAYRFDAEIWGLPNALGVAQHQMNKIRPASDTRTIPQLRTGDGRAYPGSSGYASLPLYLD